MDTSADLDVFLAEFGVNVTGPQSVSFIGILDQPDQIIGTDVRIVNTEYELTFKTSAAALSNGDALTIDGDSYLVREVLKKSDGAFSIAVLTKVEST